MKKIILAVASVLALGMLVSCKQEVSGNLTVTDIQYDAFKSTSETYYYKVEGSVKNVTVQTTITKTSVDASEETTQKVTQTTDVKVDEANNVVKVSVSKDPTSNVTTYTINLPAMKGKTTSVTKIGDSDPLDPTYSQANENSRDIIIEKIGSTFYYKNTNNVKVVIEGFDPTAATLDLSVLSEKDKTTTISGFPQWDEGKEWYATKTVTTTTPTYSLTCTKL